MQSRPFQPYLLPDEHVLWTGQPRQGLLLSGKDAMLIPFSLLWGGFALFWNAMVWFGPLSGSHIDSSHMDGPPTDMFFRLWGLPFLAAGLYFIIGRFLHDAHIRRGLFYAVTNQRILTLRGKRFVSLDIHHLPCLELAEHGDGSGTLTFAQNGAASWQAMNGLDWWLPALATSPRFFRIQNPRRIYALVRDQAAA